MQNSAKESIQFDLEFEFFRLIVIGPQSKERRGSLIEIEGRREARSMSAPARICERRCIETGGGSMATALEGIGRADVVESVYAGRRDAAEGTRAEG